MSEASIAVRLRPRRERRRLRAALFHPRTGHERTYRFYTVPYGTLAVAYGLTRDGVETAIVDDNVRRAADHLDLARELDAPALTLVGVSSMVGSQLHGGLQFALAMSQAAPETPVVWGGAAAGTIGDTLIRHPDIDHIVVGEGQSALPAMVQARADGRTFEGIPGVVTKPATVGSLNGGEAISAFSSILGFRHVYGLVDLPEYVNDDPHIADRTISYQTSIGCKANCGFCAEVALWRRHPRALPVDVVMRDLAYLVDRHQINGLKFYDAEFFFPGRERALELFERLRRSALDIRWGAAVHPANLAKLSNTELDLLAASGGSRLLVGAETAVQREQGLIRKRIDTETLLRDAERCATRGITVCFTFVTWYPDSTPDDFEATMKLAETLAQVSDLHEVKVHAYLPYPNTPLFAAGVRAGFVPPTTVEGWAHLDYYTATTPWVPDGVTERLEEFNTARYPYYGALDEENQ